MGAISKFFFSCWTANVALILPLCVSLSCSIADTKVWDELLTVGKSLLMLNKHYNILMLDDS